MALANIRTEVGTRGRRRSNWLTGLSLVVTSILLLSGCLLNRIGEVKAQTCDFNGHFVYEAGEFTELGFRSPVLLEQDVARLLGVPPTDQWQEGERSVQRYRVEKVGTPAGESEVFDVELRYRPVAGAQRLDSLRLPATVGLVVDAEAAADAALQICAAKIPSLSLSSTQAIDRKQLERFPDRSLLMSMLGLPSSVTDGGLGLTYRYRVLPPSDALRDRDAAADSEFGFTVWYDRAGDKPVRLLSDYRQFHTEADFLALEARVRYRP